MSSSLSRRRFVQGVAAMGAASSLQLHAVEQEQAQQEPTQSENKLSIADRGWSLRIDRHARWEQDAIFLPGEFSINRLPVNPPSSRNLKPSPVRLWRVQGTEWMAQQLGSTPSNILSVPYRRRTGAINWGLVNGKTQTENIAEEN